MDEFPGTVEAGASLKATCLRDFGPPPDDQVGVGDGVEGYRRPFTRNEAPVPQLLLLALKLIGLTPYGPGEKTAWSVNFTYKGDLCRLAHQKFGVRLYHWTNAAEKPARARQEEIVAKLKASTRTVERLIAADAENILGRGDATVINQHSSLHRAYVYFRQRATVPLLIEDEEDTGTTETGITWRRFQSGAIQMQANAFHDMVAAISAYVSLLEHQFVLALAFADFDPAMDDLTQVIGDRWSEKFTRVLGKDVEATAYRLRLAEVVERWRNPYSHGGFEKGHAATIYLHTEVGAVPVGLTKIRHSPLFSFIPAEEQDVTQVFDLFDELDAWLALKLPSAMQWIDSGLAVRFDKDFRTEAAAAEAEGRFERFVEMHSQRQDMIENMEFW